MAQDFINLLADLKEEEVIALTKKRLAAKEDALKIMEDARKGMEIVGKRFAGGESGRRAGELGRATNPVEHVGLGRRELRAVTANCRELGFQRTADIDREMA